MALKPCEQCKHALGSEEKVCPHCGVKQAGSRAHLAKIGLVLFALGFGVWVFDATSTKEPEHTVAAAARATPAPAKAADVAPLSDLERMLQERCGQQTDENGNWIVKGAQERARCRVQVELELERNERAARAAETQRAVQVAHEAARVEEPVRQAEPSRMAHLTRIPKATRARAAKHEVVSKSIPAAAAVSNPALNASSETERVAPAKEAKGGIDPGDDLQPLVPIGGGLNRDPVPGEPMTVRPDAAFL